MNEEHDYGDPYNYTGFATWCYKHPVLAPCVVSLFTLTLFGIIFIVFF